MKNVPMNQFYKPLMTHDEIAKKMQLSRQAVQKIEERAIRKLRAAFAAMGITKMEDLMAV